MSPRGDQFPEPLPAIQSETHHCAAIFTARSEADEPLLTPAWCAREVCTMCQRFWTSERSCEPFARELSYNWTQPQALAHITDAALAPVQKEPPACCYSRTNRNFWTNSLKHRAPLRACPSQAATTSESIRGAAAASQPGFHNTARDAWYCVLYVFVFYYVLIQIIHGPVRTLTTYQY